MKKLKNKNRIRCSCCDRTFDEKNAAPASWVLICLYAGIALDPTHIEVEASVCPDCDDGLASFRSLVGEILILKVRI